MIYIIIGYILMVAFNLWAIARWYKEITITDLVVSILAAPIVFLVILSLIAEKFIDIKDKVVWRKK